VNQPRVSSPTRPAEAAHLAARAAGGARGAWAAGGARGAWARHHPGSCGGPGGVVLPSSAVQASEAGAPALLLSRLGFNPRSRNPTLLRLVAAWGPRA
jgi:hypothetical protein